VTRLERRESRGSPRTEPLTKSKEKELYNKGHYRTDETNQLHLSRREVTL
jgi:hypothetical protein